MNQQFFLPKVADTSKRGREETEMIHLIQIRKKIILKGAFS
jgi:hypothetical protein